MKIRNPSPQPASGHAQGGTGSPIVASATKIGLKKSIEGQQKPEPATAVEKPKPVSAAQGEMDTPAADPSPVVALKPDPAPPLPGAAAAKPATTTTAPATTAPAKPAAAAQGAHFKTPGAADDDDDNYSDEDDWDL